MGRSPTTLSRLTDTVWTVDYPFRVAGLFRFRARSTIIGLPSDRLVIISPGNFDDETAQRIDELGEVVAVVAPNLHHTLFFDEACRRWPDARAMVPPDLVDDVEHADATLTDEGSFGDGVYWHELAGAPKLGEYAFVDARTGVLVLTDVAFNFESHPNLLVRFFLWCYGALDEFGPTHLVRAMIKDDKAFGESLERLLEHSWDSVVVAHGEVIERGGRERFVEAFSAYLPGEGRM